MGQETYTKTNCVRCRETVVRPGQHEGYPPGWGDVSVKRADNSETSVGPLCSACLVEVLDCLYMNRRRRHRKTV